MNTFKLPIDFELTQNLFNSFSKIDGVQNVEKESEHLLVFTLENNENTSISHILNKISEIKSDISIIEESYLVEKLSCGGCATSAEKLLRNQPGVIVAKVEYPTKSAEIIYLKNKTTPLKLKIALEQLGYELVVH